MYKIQQTWIVARCLYSVSGQSQVVSRELMSSKGEIEPAKGRPNTLKAVPKIPRSRRHSYRFKSVPRAMVLPKKEGQPGQTGFRAIPGGVRRGVGPGGFHRSSRPVCGGRGAEKSGRYRETVVRTTRDSGPKCFCTERYLHITHHLSYLQLIPGPEKIRFTQQSWPPRAY